MKNKRKIELKNKEKVIENLWRLNFIDVELINDEAIIKRKLSGRFVKLRSFLSFDWIGQILKDKYNGKYYFVYMDGFFKIDDWDKIKILINIIENE